MTISNKEMIKIIETAKKNKKKLTHITDKSKLSTEDKVKLGLCKHFVQFSVTKNIKPKALAKMIGIPFPRISEILNYKINHFTVDKLLNNLELLAEHDAEIRENLRFFEKIAELPTLKVKAIKKLSKNVNDAISENL